VHSFQTAAFAKALEMIFRVPEGLSRREVEAWVDEYFLARLSPLRDPSE
jgi:hypothetical protein